MDGLSIDQLLAWAQASMKEAGLAVAAIQATQDETKSPAATVPITLQKIVKDWAVESGHPRYVATSVKCPGNELGE